LTVLVGVDGLAIRLKDHDDKQDDDDEGLHATTFNSK
jgi:hypothetical protein